VLCSCVLVIDSGIMFLLLLKTSPCGEVDDKSYLLYIAASSTLAIESETNGAN
jgi:hypothetical protein